jgi:hypothetical protein
MLVVTTSVVFLLPHHTCRCDEALTPFGNPAGSLLTSTLLQPWALDTEVIDNPHWIEYNCQARAGPRQTTWPAGGRE